MRLFNRDILRQYSVQQLLFRHVRYLLQKSLSLSLSLSLLRYCNSFEARDCQAAARRQIIPQKYSWLCRVGLEEAAHRIALHR